MASAPKIGLDKVYVASLTADAGVSAPTYGTPVALLGAVNMTGNPNGSLITDYGDNGAYWTQNSRGNLQATLELIDCDPSVMALMLGQTRANGKTEEKFTDQSPYYAMGYRVWIGDTVSGAKIYEYFWYLKGKFAIPEQGAETKKESISPQHVTMSAEFVRLNYNDVMTVHGRTDFDLTAADASAWFSQPVYSSAQSLSAVTVGTIAGSYSGKTITIPFAKGSSETFSMNLPAAGDITVSVVSTGVLIAGTTTYVASVAGTAPTLILSNTNIAAVPYLVTVTSDVTDINGVHVTEKSQLVTPA